jgi:hypothetical protein
MARQMKRRSLSTSPGTKPPEVHATRRADGGARRQLTNRVVLRATDTEIIGWALNISRGGIRVITEERVETGQEFDVTVGSAGAEPTPTRRGRIVWVQEERDGMIVGVKFVDAGTVDDPVPDARKDG